MRISGDGSVAAWVLWFEIVGEQLGQVFGVIVVVFVDVLQKEDQPLAEVDPVGLAAA